MTHRLRTRLDRLQASVAATPAEPAAIFEARELLCAGLDVSRFPAKAVKIARETRDFCIQTEMLDGWPGPDPYSDACRQWLIERHGPISAEEWAEHRITQARHILRSAASYPSQKEGVENARRVLAESLQ